MASTEDHPPQPRSVADRIRAASGAAATEPGHGERSESVARSALERALGTGGATTADRLAALKREAASRRSELDADLEELRGGAEAVAKGVPAETVVTAGQVDPAGAQVDVPEPQGAVPDAPQGYPQPPQAAQQRMNHPGYAPQTSQYGSPVPPAPHYGAPPAPSSPYAAPPGQAYGPGAAGYGMPSAPGTYGTSPVPAGRPNAMTARPTPGRPAAPPSTSGPATAALVLSIASVTFAVSGFFGVLLALVSLQVGRGARRTAKATGQSVPGKLTAATLVAILGLALSVVAIVGQVSG